MPAYSVDDLATRRDILDEVPPVADPSSPPERMSGRAAVQYLRDRGLTVERRLVDGEPRLTIDPPGRVDAAIRAFVFAHRDAILQELLFESSPDGPYPPGVLACYDEAAREWITPTEFTFRRAKEMISRPPKVREAPTAARAESPKPVPAQASLL